MPNEPVRKIRLDKTLQKYGNGRIPKDLLKPILGGGVLYEPAAEAFNRMYRAAQKDDVLFVPIAHGYRSISEQELLFFDRYVPRPTLRRPAVKRLYENKTWWLKRGKSPSATPGKSPHGWGLAQDLDVRDPKVFDWLCANAWRFGFYLQGHKYLPNGKPNPEYEAWHWQYCDL